MIAYIIKYLDETFKNNSKECFTDGRVFMNKIDAHIALQQYNELEDFFYYIEEVNLVQE